MAFVIVSIGVVVLRRTRPDLPRPFRMPLVPVLPILSAVVSLLLMMSLPWTTWERLIIWMALGVAVYFGYGYRHSRLRRRGGAGAAAVTDEPGNRLDIRFPHELDAPFSRARSSSRLLRCRSVASRSSGRFDRIGLQLYSVRDLMKADVPGRSPRSRPSGSRRSSSPVSSDKSPKDVRAALDKNGLTAPAAHVDWVTMDTKLAETVEAAKVLGHRFLIIPWIGEEERKQPDIWKKAADLFNRVGAQTARAGIQFAYHQHGFEFVPADSLGGKLPYDYLLENTDPKLVQMELDICWTVAAGKDPGSLLRASILDGSRSST